MRPKDFEIRVNEAMSGESFESLEGLISTIRLELEKSDTAFLRLSYLLGISILAYQLITFGYIEDISFGGGKLINIDIFVKSFLIYPSAVYLVLMATGYIRIYQKRLLELLIKKQHPGLYDTNLDMLLQPSNFISSLDYLRREPGSDRLFWTIVSGIPATIFGMLKIFGPSIYMVVAFAFALDKYGHSDLLLIISAAVSSIFLICGLLIFRKSSEVLGSA